MYPVPAPSVGPSPIPPSPDDAGASSSECDAEAPTGSEPDLVLELGANGSTAHFTTRTFEAESCSVYEGCVRGSGKRSLLEVNVLVRNVGGSAISLGAPWESELFYESLCQDGYVFDGFISAKLYNGEQLVEEGRLSTSCVSKDDGLYRLRPAGAWRG